MVAALAHREIEAEQHCIGERELDLAVIPARAKERLLGVHSNGDDEEPPEETATAAVGTGTAATPPGSLGPGWYPDVSTC